MKSSLRSRTRLAQQHSSKDDNDVRFTLPEMLNVRTSSSNYMPSMVTSPSANQISSTRNISADLTKERFARHKPNDEKPKYNLL